MTAERWGAVLMTLGLSLRVSQLARLDRSEYIDRHHRTPR